MSSADPTNHSQEAEELLRMGFSEKLVSQALAATASFCTTTSSNPSIQAVANWILTYTSQSSHSPPMSSSQSNLHRFIPPKAHPSKCFKPSPPSSLPPLSERMRPSPIESILGQDHLLSPTSHLPPPPLHPLPPFLLPADTKPPSLAPSSPLSPPTPSHPSPLSPPLSPTSAAPSTNPATPDPKLAPSFSSKRSTYSPKPNRTPYSPPLRTDPSYSSAPPPKTPPSTSPPPLLHHPPSRPPSPSNIATSASSSFALSMTSTASASPPMAPPSPLMTKRSTFSPSIAMVTPG